MRAVYFLAAAALGTLGAPARADEATCAAIVAAARSIGQAPQYRSVLVATSPNRRRPVEREQVVVGNTIYAASAGAGRWMKLPMTAADREGLAAGLVRYPPHHCEVTDQVLEGAVSRVYAYRQDVTGSDSAVTRLWVDGRDGLPRRLESQEGTTRVVVTLEYGNVTPPNIH